MTEKVYRRLFCLVSALLCVFFSGCQRTADLTGYQGGELSLTVAYDAGGVPIVARAELSAGGAERDMTLTVLEPASLAGITFCRTAGVYSAALGDTVIPVTSLAEAMTPLSLFSIPTAARVTSIERDGDTRTATLKDGSDVYTLCFMGDGTVPVSLARDSGNTHLAITVREVHAP